MNTGRRMATAGVVMAAVAVGGVAGALIGIPGTGSASSSPPAVSTAAAGGSGGSGSPGHSGRHFRGFGRAVGADKGVLDAAAKDLKLSTKDLLEKLSDGKTTIAALATQAGVSPQTVIDDMTAVAKSDISDLVNNPFPTQPKFDGKFPGGGKGRDHGGIGAFGFGIGGHIGDSIDGVAKALGISQQDLLKDIGNGQSLADIAKSKNVDVNKLIQTLVDDAKSKIEAAAKDGHLSADQVTKLESNLQDMISKMVNMSLPKGLGDFGAFGGHGGHGEFGPGGFPGGPGASGGSGYDGAAPSMPPMPAQ